MVSPSPPRDDAAMSSPMPSTGSAPTPSGRPFLLATSRDDRWLVNSYLLGDRVGGEAVVIDSGAPMEPLVVQAGAWELRLREVWCTHHHPDHCAHNRDYRQRLGCRIRVPAAEVGLFREEDRGAPIAEGEDLRCGALTLEAWSIPGHTIGQMAFLLPEQAVFTGDTLFRGSVGGTMGPGHGTTAQLRQAVMERLMRLPPEVQVYPGHMQASTIGAEWEHNPFVRYWRGLVQPTEARCVAFEREAQLLLRARDYDGGWKALLRFDGEQEETLVPGSRVRMIG